MKKSVLPAALLLTITCCACQSAPSTVSDLNAATETISLSLGSVTDQTISESTATILPVEYTEQTYTLSGNLCETFTVADQTSSYDLDTTTIISISGNNVDVTGSGVSVTGSQIVISKEGSYLINGTLEDGQIYVHADVQAKVQLILNNVSLHCSTSSPIFVDTADKVILTIPADTVNTLTDGAAYLDDAANGCIFSRSDLTINGEGTLNVTGNYNNAISCKDDLKIVSGILNLTAVNNALKGNDSVSIQNGTITIESKEDGIKVDNDLDADKGFILIVDASISITADDDCLQSPRAVVILGGNILARSFDKIVNCDGFEIGTDEYITNWI